MVESRPHSALLEIIQENSIRDDQTPRSFLLRNVTRNLDSHQRGPLRPRFTSHHSSPGSARNDMIDGEEDGGDPRPPNTLYHWGRETINSVAARLCRPLEPLLAVNIKSLKRKLPASPDSATNDEPPAKRHQASP